ncbi:MAG: peptidoglycan DD-metalloendopeptidase family protein, partial [Hyphomicrobiales bacterium]|nr:peptidoglycan DD-metalloendopeptidase family protein [Hyphomicrobiales bacterium]
ARAPAATGSVASANYPALTPVPKAPATALGAPSGWTAAGGTPVTLQPGETISTLSNRYGVPASAILAVNGLSNATQARPGQQVVIPAYNPVTGNRPPAQLAQAAAAIDRPKPEPVKVQPRPVAQPLPRAGVPQAASVKVEPPKAAPTRQVLQKAESEAEKRAAARLRAEKATPVKVEPPKPRTKPNPDDVETTASIPSPKLPPKSAPMVARNEPPKAEEKPAETGGGADTPEFRWPAKGRVISGFGARGTGGANDGINIALPEGTPVRAAEGGTVVHADDALKGYGKLVLIRHPNGYVSVYAHNSELKVKRGESVRRGQVIASSGQSGNVTAPQLHFEIRKGATPVDPSKYLGE